MRTRLFVRLHRETNVPGETFDWVLRDWRGAELRRGKAPLLQLPRAHEVAGVIAHDLVVTRAVSLPPGARARSPVALANAMEPYLLSEPASNHVVVLGDANDGTTVLAAVARTWIDPCMAAFTSAGRPLGLLLMETSLPERRRGTWVAVCLPEGGFLRLDDERSIALDHAPEGKPAAGLKWQIESAATAGRAVQRLIVYHEGNVDGNVWRNSLGVPVETAGRWDWARMTGSDAGFSPKSARDILRSLQQENAAGAGELRAWRTPALLAVAILVIHLGASVVYWSLRAHERAQLQTEIRTSFRKSVSASEPIVDALVQTRRALGAAQRASGQYANDDFVTLLARIAAETASFPANSLRTIDYGAGALSAEWSGVPKAMLERVAERLRSHDLRVEVSADASKARLVVRAGP